jgi:hypothetical protein
VIALVGLACAAPGQEARPPEVRPAEAVLERFLAFAEGGDFAGALGLLSERWRRQYTPETFARDFARAPEAKERLARARQALRAGGRAEGEGVAFPLGGGRAVRLVREGAELRISTLE